MESEQKDLSTQPIDLKPESDDHALLQTSPVTKQSIEEMEKLYAAYVRHDVYGTMGRGNLPWEEKVLLLLALIFLVPIRVVAGFTLLIVYYLICRVCTAFRAPNMEGGREDYAHIAGWRRTVILQSGRFLTRIMLFVFGFYWIGENFRASEINGQPNGEGSIHGSKRVDRAGAIVSNHVSYIDILYHMSSCLPSFVAKRSVAKLPLVGLISKCLGCVYVQRESKSPDFRGVSGVVNERIREAYQNESAPKMLLFPEGTTTNGDYLLPFKTGAFLASAPVQPIILRYPYKRFSPAWDTISGARHVILLLCQFVNYIEVTKLPVYQPSKEEKEDPKLYAENVRRLMAREGNLILSDIGLAEKRIYHGAINEYIDSPKPTVLHQKDE